MKKFILLFVIFSIGINAAAQRLLTWTPEFPVDNSILNFTVDCTKGNQGLLNFEGGNSNNVYVHVGVITNLSTGPSDWKYVKFTWGTSDPLAHATPLGGNKYQYTISNIRTFFAVPAAEVIRKVVIIFRNATGTSKQVNSDGSDMYLPIYAQGQMAIRFNLPPSEPRYIPWLEPITTPVGGNVPVNGVCTPNSILNISVNGVSTVNTILTSTITTGWIVTSACSQQLILTGDFGGGNILRDTNNFSFLPAPTIAALPAGVQEGINYAANNTSVTLVLYAPNKTNTVVIGDFSNWAIQCSNQMNRTPDGNYFWVTINGLTPGTEYAYQYLVDNNLRIADPYAQKILDPSNDQFIDNVTYPNLKPYPTGLTTDIVSVFQTAEPQYNWQVNNFAKPDKKNLVIYELLIRDFTAQHSYKSLIDSFQYFKNLGINAIELMPINEFDGNESWGYNSDFYFAPDKYYGTKNKLKEFIDTCHRNGIAVILDVVYNHCTGNAPQAKMYWDAVNNRPAANSPWLNTVTPHAYAFFNDFNHTSAATQYLVQRSLDHWLNEYKVDGFRFDLAKGFTQTVSNPATIENYDATRVANLKRYYNGTVPGHPGTYMILEFLGTLPAQEEQEYAAHGFMLWGNNNATYNQCTMGYASNSDISPVVYSDPKKGFNNPAEVGYMESHDEERTMYKNLNFGNAAGGYNVRTLATALAREEAAAAVFFTVPGPKMIWQFEERGYDIPLNFGGSNVANKPPHWEYMQDPNRKHLYDAYKRIIQLRLNNPAVFNNNIFSYDFNASLVKSFQIADPSNNGLSITVVANLDVVTQTKAINFQTPGNWTNYISNGTGTGVNGTTGSNFLITTTAQDISLQPGEYHIYVSVPCTIGAPGGLNVTAITHQFATLNWLTTTGYFYTVDYRPVGTTSWINAATAITANSKTVSGLQPGITYEWRVSASCTQAVINNYTSGQFTTGLYNSTIVNQKNGYGIKISPNPVTGKAMIDYIVSGYGTVTITLFNSFGQKLQTVVNVIQLRGQHQFAINHQFDVLAKGSYFLKLQQNSNTCFTQFIKH